MADSATTKVLFSGRNKYNVLLTNSSDGTGESAVAKIDKSTLTGPNGTEPGKLVIEEVIYDVNGFEGVKLLIEHTTADDNLLLILSGSGYRDFRPTGGLRTSEVSTDGTGDLLVTTLSTGAGAAGDSYNIEVRCRLKD